MKKFRQLILCTFLSHFFILFGFAHAGACIGFIEILYFPYITNEQFTFLPTQLHDSSLPAVGLLGLIGNIVLLVAAFVRRANTRMTTYYSSLVTYWVSIAYLWYDSIILGNTQFSIFFCLPLLVITLLVPMRKHLRAVSGWFNN